MAVPTGQEIRLPLLTYAAESEYRFGNMVKALENHFSLTEEERKELANAGKTRIFYDRCSYAQDDLRKAGLLEPGKPNHRKITVRGIKVLKQNLESIDNRFLKQLRESAEPLDNYPTPESFHTMETTDRQTVEESIEKNYQQIRSELAEELLQQIGENTPRFFEELVIDLLVKMGYGGSREDAEAVGRSGDGGIDGIINEDRLGLDVVYVQAKRWEGNVGRPEIHKFTGALIEKNARKGIFITTSDFSREARESADNSDDPKIVLIDGRQLAEYMIDHNVGVSTVKTYEIKRVDSDYFIDTDDSQTQDS